VHALGIGHVSDPVAATPASAHAILPHTLSLSPPFPLPLRPNPPPFIPSTKCLLSSPSTIGLAHRATTLSTRPKTCPSAPPRQRQRQRQRPHHTPTSSRATLERTAPARAGRQETLKERSNVPHEPPSPRHVPWALAHVDDHSHGPQPRRQRWQPCHNRSSTPRTRQAQRTCLPWQPWTLTRSRTAPRPPTTSAH
jgi:hypothetical protein